MKLLPTILCILTFLSVKAQEADYDDLYFNSVDRALVKKDKKVKSKTVKSEQYLPSKHQDYDYYMEYKTFEGKMQIQKLKLDSYFLIPMTVSDWTFYQIKNVHLIHPELSLGYSYKYHSRLILLPFPYIEGTRSRYIIHWESPKVNFYLMR